jgi:L-ascorbate metabolism protein UlaG (beta-lactamase superfamily)
MRPRRISAQSAETVFAFPGVRVNFGNAKRRFSMKTWWMLMIGGGPFALAAGGVMAADAVQVQWFGQLFFQFTSSSGAKLVIDPFDNTYFNYPIPKGLTADVLLVTHEHNDHNNIGIIGGSPLICRSEKGVGRFERKGITVTGTAAFHDESRGAERGKNTVYSFDIDGVGFCHAGDLGHLLDDAQLKSIGPVEVLLLPVGGFFTIDTGKLDKLVTQLNPRVVVAMHFKTRYTPKLPIAGVDEYLKGKPAVKRLGADSFSISKAGLPAKQEVWVLEIK